MPTKNRREKRHEISFWQKYSFELTVVFLLATGIFLLVEKMKIKSYIYRWLITGLRFIAKIFKTIGDFIVTTAMDVETSDIIGYILILIAIGMIFYRFRFRLIRKYSILRECPECGGNMHRIHRKPLHQMLGVLLITRIKYYSCKKCSYKGITFGAGL